MGRGARSRALGASAAAVGVFLVLAGPVPGASADGGGGRTLKLRRPTGEKVSIAYHPEAEKVEIGSRVRQQQLFPAGEAQKLVELAEEWASERGWNQEVGGYWPDPQADSNIPIYDFNVHGKMGKGVLMDRGSQGLWPLARHACGLLENSLEEGFQSSGHFCKSVSITKLMPGNWREQRSSVSPGYRHDLQSLHVQLNAPEASEGGDLYLCQKMPPSWREMVTRLDLFGETPLFQYLFDSERLKDPASPCQWRPLSQGAALSQVGGRVGGISPVTKGATYFLTVSFSSSIPKPVPYSKEPYGPAIIDSIETQDIFAFFKNLRYFIHATVSDLLPERFVEAFLFYEPPASGPGRDPKAESSSLLEDLTLFFARALKKSEKELMSESLKTILHLLSRKGRTSLFERERFRQQLNGQALVMEGLEKYGSDTNFRDISCSVLKKLPCLHASGRLDLGLSSTCEGGVEACVDFKRISLEDLAVPNFPTKREEYSDSETPVMGARGITYIYNGERSKANPCVEGLDLSFGSSDASKMSDECLMQAVKQYEALADDADNLTPMETRAKVKEAQKEVAEMAQNAMVKARQDEKEEFLRKMRGEL